MWEAMEQWGWVKAFNISPWMYNATSVVHYLTFFWCIGSIVIVDLRIMGLAARRRDPVQLASQLFPSAWVGLTLTVLSGILMFMPQAGEWAPDPVFHVKLTLMIVALAFAVIVQKSVPKWSKGAETLRPAKKASVLSLLPWVLSILCASLVILFGFGLLCIPPMPQGTDWARDPRFLALALVALALAVIVIVQGSVSKWAIAAEIPRVAKLIAFLSVLLWILTIVWGSEIPSREGLG